MFEEIIPFPRHAERCLAHLLPAWAQDLGQGLWGVKVKVFGGLGFWGFRALESRSESSRPNRRMFAGVTQSGPTPQPQTS